MHDPAQAVLSGECQVVVIDVEATCWKQGVWSRRKETIEIGAVRYSRERREWEEFQSFVRPLRLPKLSTFCRELTGISQADVDPAPLFPAALHAFLEWAAPIERVVLASWSRYDLWQLDLDLELHGLPRMELPHLDVKKLATRILGGKSFADTAAALGVPFPEGRHRAILDARVTARILDRLINPGGGR